MKHPKPKPAAAVPAAGDATRNVGPQADTTHAGDARPLRLEPGAVPVPEYQLVQFLGRGGYGEVWKAKGPGGYAVALKFIALGADAAAAEQRSAELLRVKDIRHPHLLGLFGSWRRSGMLIFAMELADRTLMDRFSEARRQGLPGVPFAELREYMREAAKGLDHLHAIGVQHRDVKPQNLLLVGGGVKVADFGLAKVLEQTTASNTGSMTPAYAAPEFLKGRVSPHSDQYSLAVAYCQLRGGQLPFNGGPAQIMMGHLYETPDLTGVPEEERPTVLKALAKDPEQRFASCRDFVEALANTVHTVRPVKTPKPAPPAHRRSAPSPQPTERTAQLQPVRRRSASGETPRRAVRKIPTGGNGPRPHRLPWLALILAGLLLAAIGAAAVAPFWLNRKPVDDGPPPTTQTNTTPPPTTPGRVVLHLAPIGPVTLEPGKSATIQAAVQRDDHSRPIEFGLEGLPDGVQMRRLPGAADADAALFELTADPNAGPVQAWAKATARVADAKAEGVFHLTVASALAVKPNDGGASEAVRAAIRQGRDHLALSEWGQARASFGVAIELNANNAEAYALRAKANDNSHRYDDALADADKAIALNPQSALAYAYRCEIYADKGDLDNALADGEQAVGLDPQSAVARRSRGYVHSLKMDKDAALSDFDEAIRLDPLYPDPYIDRGYAHLDADAEDDALNDFNRAVALAPHLSGGFIGRSAVHAKQEKWDDALSDLNDAVQAAPKDPDALTARAQYRHDRSDRDGAMTDYRAASRLAPKLAEPHIFMAGLWVEKGDGDRAIEEYSEAIELDPKNAVAFNGRAWQRYRKADYDAALNDFSDAIGLDGKSANDYDGRGWCRFRKADYDAAVEDFTQALDLEPQNADALAGRGWTYRAQGKNDMALDDLNASLQINSKDASNFNERGLLYFDKADYAKAIDDFTEAINLNPSDAQLYLNRADAYEKNGEADKAEADRKKAEEIKKDGAPLPPAKAP
ncbi:MAG TPA: tetratricopeptide repeat protein [Gemmataceae bacterium]|nr:tetratricopeptide repeat protein [Gemmataceae bacterium]